jgi:hypothetical protein
MKIHFSVSQPATQYEVTMKYRSKLCWWSQMKQNILLVIVSLLCAFIVSTHVLQDLLILSFILSSQNLAKSKNIYDIHYVIFPIFLVLHPILMTSFHSTYYFHALNKCTNYSHLFYLTFSCNLMDQALWPVAIHNQFWNYESYTQLVGLLGRGNGPSQGRYLQRTQTQNKRRQTTMSGVGFEPTTPSVWGGEDISCLWPRGQCDRLYLISGPEKNAFTNVKSADLCNF